MKAGLKQNRKQAQIKQHLKSAITDITPNVLERIDLSVPQEPQIPIDKVVYLQRKFRPLAAVAACLCVLLLFGGIYTYEEGKIVSVVGIDVNPSIEFSLNRRNKVVKAEAINDDGTDIIGSKKLQGSSLDTALNSVIHSMVEHGYLQEEENALLVTVSDYRKRDTQNLSQSVVANVEKSLEENHVKAVVYNQQIEVTDELRQLAGEYEISCGKAYFVQEIIDKNENLDMSSMEKLSALKIDELSKEINENQLAVADGSSSLPETEQDLEDMTIEEEETEETDEDVSLEETAKASSEALRNPESAEESTQNSLGSSPAEESTQETISDDILDENEYEPIATPGDALDEGRNDTDSYEGGGEANQEPKPSPASPLDAISDIEDETEELSDEETEDDVIFLE